MNCDSTHDQRQNNHRTPDSPELWRAANAAHQALFGGESAHPSEIWTIKVADVARDEDLLLAVVTDATDELVTVVPISSDVRYATEWDLIIPRGVLGYDAIAQVKLAGSVKPAQLDQRLSSLPKSNMSDLRELAQSARRGDSLPPEHLPVGPYVLTDTDERLRVRAQNADRLRAYLLPNLDRPGDDWMSFGSIVARYRTISAIDLRNILELPVARWNEKLERDELDLLSHVPARKMAAMLAALRIKWTDRVRDALYAIAVDRYRPGELAHGTALGRRRGTRARRTRRTGPPTQEHERAAHDYVARVEDELKRL